MKKKTLVILLTIFSIGVLSGVVGQFVFLRPVPELAAEDKAAASQVLKAYFTAWQSEKPEQMYSHISAEDRAVVSIEEYVQQFRDYPIIPLQCEIVNLVGNSEIIKATVILHWPLVDEDDTEEHTEQFYLHKEKTWKIVEKSP